MNTYPIGLVPGPVSVPQKIREAWLTDFGSSDLEADFYDLYASNQRLVQNVLGTRESVVITSGEAMSILWGGVKSALRPGEKLLAVASGLFGEGFADMARAIGMEAEVVAFPYNDIPDPQKVREAARRFRPQLITAVHCETPSGTLTPNLGALGQIAREVDALFLVDFVSSGGGTPVEVDTNLIDIGLLGSQKVLSLPSSLSVSTLSSRAWSVFERVKYSGYDAYLPWRKVPEIRAMPYTHDWQGMAALNIALESLMKEGLENAYARHDRVAHLCRTLGREMGLTLFPAREEICAPTVTAFNVPEGWTWPELDAALRRKGLVAGGNYGSLDGRVFRIGHMGSQADETLVTKGMQVLGEVLRNR